LSKYSTLQKTTGGSGADKGYCGFQSSIGGNMNAVGNQPAGVISETRERRIVLWLGLFAAVHVFIFSAAFPFFNNVDEQSHFDLVVKYSRGAVPRAMETSSAEAIPYIIVYETLEYFWPPTAFTTGKIPPPVWTQPVARVAERLQIKKTSYETGLNHESSQPPLYYLLAGAGWRCCKFLGFHDGFLLYSVRFLNLFFVMAIVWVGHAAARLVFPEKAFGRIGVPALLAVFPQTAFYSIQNDVLSPLCFGAAFICLVKWLRAEVPDVRLGMATGAALAATYLAKASNLPLLGVSALVVLPTGWQLIKTAKRRAGLPALAALVLGAGLPMGGWMLWCQYHFGDLSGSAAKIQLLGWTYKSFSDWGHHPLFTPQGLWTFLSGLIATFWQGEFLWQRQPLSLPAINLIYAVASLGVIAMGTASLFPARASLRASLSPAQRQALWLAFGCLAAAVGFLAFLSIIYDFHNCFYPSREHPYFTSGRLMLGALIPFLLLFFQGIDWACGWFKNQRVRPLALGGIILFILVSEIMTNGRVFPNPYNWFHL
jgi:hypothetical protein